MKASGSSLLIAEHPLVVLPTLAREVGINEAIVVQQIHYWSLHKEADDDGITWVYNTQEEWLKQFPWLSIATLKRAIKKLLEAELIEVKQLDKINRTNHYRVRYENLPGDQSDPINLIPPTDQSDPLTSNKAETSAEKNPSSPLPASSVVKSETTREIESVWETYVAVMKPRGRGRELDPESRKLIREALKVADAAELQRAIEACGRSDFHMKRGKDKNRPGGKYNALAQIIKSRRGRNETTRSRIEWWLDRADEFDAGKKVTFDVNAEARRIREEQERD